MKTEKMITEIKIEDTSEVVDETCEFEYFEIETIDIKEEITEGKISFSYSKYFNKKLLLKNYKIMYFGSRKIFRGSCRTRQ